MSEFVQYGVVGIALALVGAIVYMAKLFVGAPKDVYGGLGRLNVTISELSAEVKAFSRIRKHKRESTPMLRNDGTAL